MGGDFYKNVYGSMATGTLRSDRSVMRQKGNGFFGRVVRGSIMPLVKSVLPFLKDVALDGVGGLVDDLKAGKSVKEAVTSQLKRTTSDVMARAKKKMRGGGVRRRKRMTGAGVKRRKRRTGVKRRKRRVTRSTSNRRSLFQP